MSFRNRTIFFVAVALLLVGAGVFFWISTTRVPAAVTLDAGTSGVTLNAATTTVLWAGYSTNTYTGLLSVGATLGLQAANSICNSNFPGSRWAQANDIISLGTAYPWTNNAWLANFYGNTGNDCSHFTLASSSQHGTSVSTVTIIPGADVTNGQNCGNFLKLACVYIVR